MTAPRASVSSNSEAAERHCSLSAFACSVWSVSCAESDSITDRTALVTSRPSVHSPSLFVRPAPARRRFAFANSTAASPATAARRSHSARSERSKYSCPCGLTGIAGAGLGNNESSENGVVTSPPHARAPRRRPTLAEQTSVARGFRQLISLAVESEDRDSHRIQRRRPTSADSRGRLHRQGRANGVLVWPPSLSPVATSRHSGTTPADARASGSRGGTSPATSSTRIPHPRPSPGHPAPRCSAAPPRSP